MTNKEFTTLSIEDKMAYFKALTSEEVADLTQLQKEAYEAAKANGFEAIEEKEEEENEDEAADPQKKKAEKFFEDNKEYQNDYIYVTSDLNVFHGNLKGLNLVKNYGVSNPGVTFKKFLKPE